MPPHPQALQKPALLGALANFYKTTNQSLPAEVFNGENDGSFKLGDVWIDVAELFVAVFRLGGLIKVS
jgi:hypothetical protein